MSALSNLHKLKQPSRQVLELLLSQERVISLLYDRALPPRMSFGGFGGIADIVTAGCLVCCRYARAAVLVV